MVVRSTTSCPALLPLRRPASGLWAAIHRRLVAVPFPPTHSLNTGMVSNGGLLPVRLERMKAISMRWCMFRGQRRPRPSERWEASRSRSFVCDRI